MATQLDLRNRRRSRPHKPQMGVSGCAREGAEARGKDVGVIATDGGWNLYVGGNGGATPAHAQLLASAGPGNGVDPGSGAAAAGRHLERPIVRTAPIHAQAQ